MYFAWFFASNGCNPVSVSFAVCVFRSVRIYLRTGKRILTVFGLGKFYRNLSTDLWFVYNFTVISYLATERKILRENYAVIYCAQNTFTRASLWFLLQWNKKKYVGAVGKFPNLLHPAKISSLTLLSFIQLYLCQRVRLAMAVLNLFSLATRV